jgi:hypothetical protein
MVKIVANTIVAAVNAAERQLSGNRRTVQGISPASGQVESNLRQYKQGAGKRWRTPAAQDERRSCQCETASRERKRTHGDRQESLWGRRESMDMIGAVLRCKQPRQYENMSPGKFRKHMRRNYETAVVNQFYGELDINDPHRRAGVKPLNRRKGVYIIKRLRVGSPITGYYHTNVRMVVVAIRFPQEVEA